jgi:hypothetical protein
MNFRPNPLLYGANEGFFSAFKLVVTMRDEVEHARPANLKSGVYII